MFVKKANKPTNRWSPGFKSEQNMFVVLNSVPQHLMDQSNLIRDASDQPSGVFMVRTSTRGDSRHFRIQRRGFGSAAAPRGSVCGLITQQSSWRRDEGFSWIQTTGAAILELHNTPSPPFSPQTLWHLFLSIASFPSGTPRSRILFYPLHAFCLLQSNPPPLPSSQPPHTSIPQLFCHSVFLPPAPFQLYLFCI